jgi:hypothetical protein
MLQRHPTSETPRRRTRSGRWRLDAPPNAPPAVPPVPLRRAFRPALPPRLTRRRPVTHANPEDSFQQKIRPRGSPISLCISL